MHDIIYDQRKPVMNHPRGASILVSIKVTGAFHILFYRKTQTLITH
jgi:hypothetical protein